MKFKVIALACLMTCSIISPSYYKLFNACKIIYNNTYESHIAAGVTGLTVLVLAYSHYLNIDISLPKNTNEMYNGYIEDYYDRKRRRVFVSKSEDKQVDEIINELSWLTIQNILIASGTVVALYLVLKLYQCFRKPTFNELVKKYIDDTEEIDARIVKEQLYKELNKHGYTTKTDMFRTKLALQRIGLNVG